MTSVLEEARSMVDAGVREILLLGQNVAAYGLNGDIRPPADDHSPFAELLEALNEIPGLLRIRYTSPYVSYFNKRLISALSRCSKVCRNIHLPLQSGSNRILQAMNRQYTRESYLEKVAQLREAVPGLTFSTDVIVGFPGEEESDFLQTREVMNEVGFEQAFIFKYSPRPGTPSALLADDVPREEKERRNQTLLDDQERRGQERNDRLVGSRRTVMVEGPSKRDASRWSGRDGGNRIVVWDMAPDAPALKAGDLVEVVISGAHPQTLIGSDYDII
jgi:tRNA-2-methylthio-N6-dimethylallyladenosine synthase